MKIRRLYADLGLFTQPGKALILLGARRVGKTTLLLDYLKDCQWRYKLDSGDDLRVQQILSSGNFDRLKEYTAGYDLLAIDEAQKIPAIGQGLKILVDQVPDLRIIATGSSSFELAGQVGEPLTGRKRTLSLYSVAQTELQNIYNHHELKEQLSQRLIFGNYPDIFSSPTRLDKIRILEELVGSFLLKDILELERVKGSKILLDLLRLIAFQVGSEVSLSELASLLAIDTKTVARYLDLFEKSFVIYNLRGFSRNLRKEVTKKSKYYFYDNGVRNAIISNFNDLDIRNDVGALWENFLVMERLKKAEYSEIYANRYFWRTWDQQEIDWVEERDGRLFGFEFKWQSDAKVKKKADWTTTYPEATLQVVNRDNYLDFVT
jgi:uncharacterized protein